jgi:glycosyltransferase involved in cell wall biosynthesis
MKKISLIIPFYNEGSGVAAFFGNLEPVLAPMQAHYSFEIICVNDGSQDNTLEQLIACKANRPNIKILEFSRNFGKEAAITAGLDYAEGDAVIPMDSDLQHPPETIPVMIEKWEQAFDVVLAKRADRDTDGFFQEMTARAFYEVSKHISHVDIPADVGDFRLMDKKVVEALKAMRETCRFMKGIFSWVGFRTVTIEYKVNPRLCGKSSFNTWKRWNFALEGITSFSTVPLRVWTYLGGAITFLSFCYAFYLVVKTAWFGVDVPGFASLMVAILGLSGVQLIGIGVLGEYIGRIFMESKQRPVYIVRQIY